MQMPDTKQSGISLVARLITALVKMLTPAWTFRMAARLISGWRESHGVKVNGLTADGSALIESSLDLLAVKRPWVMRYLRRYRLMVMSTHRKNSFGSWGPVIYLSPKHGGEVEAAAVFIYYSVVFRKRVSKGKFEIAAQLRNKLGSQLC